MDRHEDNSTCERRIFGLHSSVERRAIHLGHAQIAENQVVYEALKSLQRLLPVGDRIDLAKAVTAHHASHEVTKERIIVNNQHARTPKAPRMNIAIWASITRFILGKMEAANRT